MFLDRFLRGPESRGGSESKTEHLTPRCYFDEPRMDDLRTTFGHVVKVKNITPLSE